MITELTPEQSAQLDAIREKWIAAGLSTAPADRARAEAGVPRAYEAAGLAPPGEIIWTASPWALQAKARELLGYPAGRWVHVVGGNLWAGTGAFYDSYAMLGIAADLTEGWRMIAESAGWWIPLDEVCLISDRPELLKRDDEGRLHCEDGPAMRWPDGYSLHAIHGVRVPAEVIESDPATWNPLDVINEPNAEVRRVMMDRFGPDRLVQELDAKQASDEFGTLHRICLSEDEDLVFVEVVNSTPEPDGMFKNYWLRVPPSMSTPREAVAWTFDLDSAEYLPTVMT